MTTKVKHYLPFLAIKEFVAAFQKENGHRLGAVAKEIFDGEALEDFTPAELTYVENGLRKYAEGNLRHGQDFLEVANDLTAYTKQLNAAESEVRSVGMGESLEESTDDGSFSPESDTQSESEDTADTVLNVTNVASGLLGESEDECEPCNEDKSYSLSINTNGGSDMNSVSELLAVAAKLTGVTYSLSVNDGDTGGQTATPVQSSNLSASTSDASEIQKILSLCGGDVASANAMQSEPIAAMACGAGEEIGGASEINSPSVEVVSLGGPEVVQEDAEEGQYGDEPEPALGYLNIRDTQVTPDIRTKYVDSHQGDNPTSNPYAKKPRFEAIDPSLSVKEIAKLFESDYAAFKAQKKKVNEGWVDDARSAVGMRRRTPKQLELFKAYKQGGQDMGHKTNPFMRDTALWKFWNAGARIKQKIGDRYLDSSIVIPIVGASTLFGMVLSRYLDIDMPNDWNEVTEPVKHFIHHAIGAKNP